MVTEYWTLALDALAERVDALETQELVNSCWLFAIFFGFLITHYRITRNTQKLEDRHYYVRKQLHGTTARLNQLVEEWEAEDSEDDEKPPPEPITVSYPETPENLSGSFVAARETLRRRFHASTDASSVAPEDVTHQPMAPDRLN